MASGRLQFGSKDNIFLSIHITSVSSGDGLTGLTPTIKIVAPNGTELVPTSANLVEVNASVVPGVYEIEIPNSDFTDFGIYQYLINANDADAVKLGAGSFERLIGVSTTSPVGGSLCSLADVQLLVGTTTAADDLLIDDLIPKVSKFMEDYTNRIFAQDDYVEIEDGIGADSHFLKNPPINSLTQVKIDDTVQDINGFVFDADAGVVFTKKGSPIFSSGRKNVEVTYNGGFATIPSSIVLVASEMVDYRFKIHKRNLWGVFSETVGEGNRSFVQTDFLPAHLEILNRYKVIPVGII